eukprot:14114210-Ditylum_brightwellii.AAC.1
MDRHAEALLIHHALTQYSLKQGIEKFGKQGKDAVVDEFQQLHDMDTFDPKHEKELTSEQKRKALKALMFLKQKRHRLIKGRTCADERAQRGDMPKGDAASPTVSPEAVLITAVIDTMEGRDVAVTDIPGAYLNAFMDEYVLMVLEGKLAELLVKVAPNIY